MRLLSALFIFMILLFGCTFLQQAQEEKKETTVQKREPVGIWKSQNITVENKTSTEPPPQPIIEIENKTENTSAHDPLPMAQSYKLNLGESIAIENQLYTFCDYAHRAATTTKISFCLGNSPALGFHALVGQEVPIGNYTVLVTNFVPRDNVVGLPEIAYLELILSPKN